MSQQVTFRVFRGEPDADGDPFGRMVDYTVEMDEGMVVGKESLIKRIAPRLLDKVIETPPAHVAIPSNFDISHHLTNPRAF